MIETTGFGTWVVLQVLPVLPPFDSVEVRLPSVLFPLRVRLDFRPQRTTESPRSWVGVEGTRRSSPHTRGVPCRATGKEDAGDRVPQDR